jgi:PAS domain S-box-containing protein
MNPVLAPQGRHDVKPADDCSFRIFVQTVRDYALFMLDTQGYITTWNMGAQAIHGYQADEVIGRHFSVFYPPAALQREQPRQELDSAARDGHFEDEGWRVRKDGSHFWANVVLTALRGPDGKLLGYAKVTRDLTERRRHEEHLRMSEARFRALVEGVRDYAIFMLDVDGDIASWNAGAEQILGYQANEVIGTHFSRFLPEGPRLERSRHGLDVAAIQGRFQEEAQRVRQNGEVFWANVVITALRAPTGELLGFSNITRDLTERRRHQAALRTSEERFRLLVDSVVDYAIVTLDEEGNIKSWNRGAEKINGYPSAEILGRHFSQLFPPEDIRANKPWKQLQQARERGRVYDESWRMRADGTQYWANCVIARMPAIESRSDVFYMVTQDLTHRRHAETLADTAQRMHEFIAMLAHELRNPLAPIRNAVALMRRREVADPLIEAMRQTIDRQSLNLTRIVDELLDVNRVARGQLNVEKQFLDLRDVLARAVETSRPVIDTHGHRLHISIADKPIEVFGDPMRLAQVVVNILNNAAKYTPDGGDIWLAAARAGGRAELRVRDNGRGIQRDSIDRIFDLFTQIDPAVGSALGGLGVGLALVRRIVELHGGTVNATSDGLGRGSQFVVRLPLAQMAQASQSAQADVPARAIEPEEFRPLRILVVDDNEDAANGLGQLLQTLGHEVRVVFDGPSAIAVSQELRPELAMLDIGMPVMNGYDVARALRSADPKLVLVAVTGWGHEAARRQAQAAGFQHHLVKPVTESTLIELVANVAMQRDAHS